MATDLRISPREWQAMLQDTQMQARVYTKIYRRDGCHYWLGAISDTGHGKLRAPRHLGNRVVASHVYSYQLARGLLPGPPWPVLRHRCDETSCHNQAHILAGTAAENAADYLARRDQGPLIDRRGPARRARAIRDAILAALREDQDVELAIRRACDLGMPHVQGALF